MHILSFSGNILEIPGILEKDRGSYFCCAQNNVGKGVRHIVRVDMLFAPIITISKTKVGQLQHREAKITCHIDSYPEAIVVWFKKGIEINTNKHYRYTVNFISTTAFNNYDSFLYCLFPHV